MKENSSVEQFISHFHECSKDDNLTVTFTSGCCYWFAYILCSRFHGARLMYDPVMNHFVAEYENRLYDITGDVTEQYSVVSWNEYDDELDRKRIIDNCIEFKENEK